LSDQSTFIEAAVDDVKSSAVMGAILAVLVIWLFLRQLCRNDDHRARDPDLGRCHLRPDVLTGVSLNIMSLGGLALGVGMLVDNAIVVLESITRCRTRATAWNVPRCAARAKSQAPITASTLTTVAVFAPIVFVHGIAGQIFKDQAVTVVSSLLVSLAVALFFIPMLAVASDAGSDRFVPKGLRLGRSECSERAPRPCARPLEPWLLRRKGAAPRFARGPTLVAVHGAPQPLSDRWSALVGAIVSRFAPGAALGVDPGASRLALGLGAQTHLRPRLEHPRLVLSQGARGFAQAPAVGPHRGGFLGYGAYHRIGNLGSSCCPRSARANSRLHDPSRRHAARSTEGIFGELDARCALCPACIPRRSPLAWRRKH
jgi:hypothetical protein